MQVFTLKKKITAAILLICMLVLFLFILFMENDGYEYREKLFLKGYDFSRRSWILVVKRNTESGEAVNIIADRNILNLIKDDLIIKDILFCEATTCPVQVLLYQDGTPVDSIFIDSDSDLMKSVGKYLKRSKFVIEHFNSNKSCEDRLSKIVNLKGIYIIRSDENKTLQYYSF